MNLKKILLGIAGLIAILLIIGGGIYALYLRPFMNEMMTVHTIPYDKQLTLVLGGGGNSGILVSDSLVLVVDTKMQDETQPFYEQVKQLAGNKPIVVVNTHIHKDHVGGNSLFKGQTIIAGGNYDKDFWIKDDGAETLPTQWVKDSLVLQMGDETVTILNMPFSAHTQSDVVVYLNNRKLIFTGDLVLNGQCPAMFAKYQASSSGYLQAFDLMEKRFDIKTVVPGHGPVGGVEVIDNFRQFFKDMREAANHGGESSALVAKYKNWKHIPFLMGPEPTIRYIKGESGK